MPEPTSFLAVEDLDAAQTLVAVESGVRDRRAVEVRELELALHWADLHADDPRDTGQPVVPGAARLVRIGGVGTPKVQDLSLCELAVARGQHALTVRSLVADGLDLRHRLPELYAAFREGRVDLWAARKIASMTRKLDPQTAALVDHAVTEAVDQGAGRLLVIADEDGLRTLIAPVTPADGVWIDALLERVVDALDNRRDLIPDLPDHATRDELRSVALGWLAHPEDVLALLAGEEEPRGRGAKTRKAVVHVHLHQSALEDTETDTNTIAVARAEEVGPLLLAELKQFLGHARVTLAPVIDLTETTSVNGYEHPETVKERTRLRTTGDVFPHARTISRKADMDHPDPYQPNGPPGQTGDHNAAPLGRGNHRAKTHLDYRAKQLGLARYLWRTPNGRRRLVDRTGTHEIDLAQALELAHPGWLDAALDRIEADVRRRRA